MDIETPLVEIANLEQSYEDGFCLRVDSIAINKGQTHCLVGPTGAGKSTLLRLIAGAQRPASGHVSFDGMTPNTHESTLAIRRRIAMVFQRPLLLNTSVRANVEYGLRVRGVLGQELSNVESILARFRLESLESQIATTLSGGQMQLVALARALVLTPELLILDEPTANLDPAHVALVEKALKETAARNDMTILWATHNLFQARRVADQVALILDGRIVEDAPTQSFFESPQDPRTADFVEGRMVY
ncbi:MAG: ATP-binding cassette domain-containing protein [Pirellulales bacterium]|nr:ATP-binding cassette domain-containing protein [Pirellulales bacterium]